MSNDRLEMSLRHALLGPADSPRTGYRLKHFEQSLAYAWPASHSQIYPELARLLDDRLLEQTESGPRGSKTYALTDAGRTEIRRWLRETEPDRRVRSEAALRSFFLWVLEPEEAQEQLDRERAYWRGVLDELGDQAEPTGHSRKARAFRIALEADRDGRRASGWLDSAIAEFGSPGAARDAD
jgi:DNA-binding PadR family transcriptional regulator